MGRDQFTVGFVGLGNIGAAMAGNLLAAGHRVIGFDIAPRPEFEAAGGEVAKDIESLAAQLPDGAAMLQSLPNAEALEVSVRALEAAGRELTLVDISSYELSAKQDAAARLARAGITMLDCEVSGLPPQVAARQAIIFKAGDADAIDRLAPIFDAVADRHVYLGAFGAATQMKLIANLMVCVHNLMAAEALTLGARSGIDPTQMIAALTPSAAGSATFGFKAPLMDARNFEEGRGPFRHMFGYLRRAANLAKTAGAATPLLDAALPLYLQAEREGRGDQDIAAIIEIVEAMDRKNDHEV